MVEHQGVATHGPAQDLAQRPRGLPAHSHDGSFLRDIAFLIAFHFVPWSVSGAPRFMPWFGNFLFV